MGATKGARPCAGRAPVIHFLHLGARIAPGSCLGLGKSREAFFYTLGVYHDRLEKAKGSVVPFPVGFGRISGLRWITLWHCIPSSKVQLPTAGRGGNHCYPYCESSPTEVMLQAGRVRISNSNYGTVNWRASSVSRRLDPFIVNPMSVRRLPRAMTEAQARALVLDFTAIC